MRLRSMGLAAAMLLLASSAFAHVIDPALNKFAYKLRADIAKQVSKYTFCLVKAATTCEKKGTISAPECSLATGLVAFEPMGGKVTTKFQASIAKCDAKLLVTKKAIDPFFDYYEIGCPGDCNTNPGVQACIDLNAFEAFVESPTIATAAKTQLGTLAAGIDIFCGIDLGGVNTDPARMDCAADNAKALSKYSQGLFKCEGKCELDVKNKIGNGGTLNGVECLSGLSGNAAFNACDAAALTKAGTLSPSVAATVLPLVRTAINDATAGLYDRADPTTALPDASPCGTCGDNVRSGAEACDGADAVACPGVCTSACACP